MCQEAITNLPLKSQNGHLFAEIDGELWLIDTGSPTSFGAGRCLTIGNERFCPVANLGELTAETLSQFVSVPCVGLLGMDILSQYDLIFDVADGKLTVSTAELKTNSLIETIHLDEFMGIPIITVKIRGSDYRMFFDTGAQISYFQADLLTEFAPAGSVEDFYPGVGLFQTESYDVPMTFEQSTSLFRCGVLPETLRATLVSASVHGIVDNTILSKCSVGFFPRRHKMTVGVEKKGTGGYRYDSIKKFVNGLAVVEKKTGEHELWSETTKKGLINETGHEVLPCQYGFIGKFVDGVAVVGVGGWDWWGDCSAMFTGQWGCVDEKGNEIVPVGKYKEVESDFCRKLPWDAVFSDGMLAVCDWKTEKWGFVDSAGKEVIPCKYLAVESFKNGMAKAVINIGEDRKWIYIDKAGKEINW